MMPIAKPRIPIASARVMMLSSTTRPHCVGVHPVGKRDKLLYYHHWQCKGHIIINIVLIGCKKTTNEPLKSTVVFAHGTAQ